MNPVRLPVVDPPGDRACPPQRYGHRNRNVHVITTPMRPCQTGRVRVSPHVASIQNRMCARVFTTPMRPSKTGRDVSSPQRGGTPKPRVRLHGPGGPWSRTLGRRRFGAGTPTGLNKMRCPTHHGPIRPRVAMGAVRVVTWTDGVTSVLSHPVGVPSRCRTRPQGTAHALGVVRTLGFGVPPRCGEDGHTAGRIYRKLNLF